jgi:hypothetical protein
MEARMADRAEMERSAAWRVLTPGGQRAWRIIANEISGSGTAEISLNGFTKRGLSRVAAQKAVRQLVAVGFVEIAVGVRRVGVFKLADRWRSISDVDEARRLVQAARQGPSPRGATSNPAVPKPGPKDPKPARDERTRRPVPSLPRLSCLQGDR